ncbi:MAG: EAL domain-containing protein [Halopseudomonas sp.]
MRGQQGLRFGLLIVVVGVFAVSAVFSYLRHSETSESLAMVHKTSAWAVSELDSELLKFTQTLELVGLGARNQEQLILRFDLLWARLDILQTGSENLEVRNLAGAAELFDQLMTLLQQHEAAVFALQPGERQQAKKIFNAFHPLQPPVRELHVDSFYDPYQVGLDTELPVNQVGFGLSMLGLLLSGTVLVLLVVRESARNRLQALHDDLTGLPNRKYFNELLRYSEINARYQQTRRGLLVIDLDNFKEINDTLGHAAGDELLIKVAERFRKCVGPDVDVARLGGDEFAVLVEGTVDNHRCVQLAQKLCDRLSHGMEIRGNQVFIAASIGVSLYPDDADTLDQALINADIAMYLAKKDDGVSYRSYDPAMNAKLLRRRELSEHLRQAIVTDQLSLNYQPLIRLASRQVESVEALLRWHHPEYGYIPPLEVISIAEQYDLALELNEWVIASACKQSVIWQSLGLPQIKMAVNISPAMYAKHDLVGSVSRLLNKYGMDPEQLVIEVTEDTTMRDIESSPGILKGLRELGVDLALDDFGTGYSSLSHLKQLPVQKLKIDKSFVQDLDNEPRDLRFIRSIIGLADSLELEVVAEGVEQQHDFTDLDREGCTFGQGYLFSRPRDAAAIERILREQQLGQLLTHAG